MTINLIENIVTSRPDPAAPAREVARWAADADAYLWASTTLVPLCWALLAVYAVNVWDWTRSGGANLLWPTMGLLGVAMTMGTLSGAIAIDAALIASVDSIDVGVVELMTRISTGLFVVNWVALALALLGLSRATSALGMTPFWLDRLSIAGAVLLVGGAVQSGTVLHGFLPGLLLGLAGFIAWLLYLAVTGGVLILTRKPSPGATGSRA